MFQSIVVGTDGSERAARAVVKAAELARLCNGTLHVVSAYKGIEMSMASAMAAGSMVTTPPDIDSAAAEEEVAMEKALEDQVTELRKQGTNIQTHAVAGSPANVLLDVADSVKADLLVVGNRGLTGALRILGSVPSTLAHHSPCALLIVHTDD